MAHHFQRPLDNYFFRQSSPDFGANLARDNQILNRGTGHQPDFASIYFRSLQQLGQLAIGHQTLDYQVLKDQFEPHIPDTSNGLGLQSYTNLSAQLETLCPTTFAYAQTLVEQAPPGQYSHQQMEDQLEKLRKLSWPGSKS